MCLISQLFTEQTGLEETVWERDIHFPSFRLLSIVSQSRTTNGHLSSNPHDNCVSLMSLCAYRESAIPSRSLLFSLNECESSLHHPLFTDFSVR